MTQLRQAWVSGSKPVLLIRTLPPHESASTRISRICWNLHSRLLVSSLVCAVNAAVPRQTQEQTYHTNELPCHTLLGAWLSCVGQRSLKSQHLALSYSPPLSAQESDNEHGETQDTGAGVSPMLPPSSGIPYSLADPANALWLSKLGKLSRMFRFQFFLLLQNWSYRAGYDVKGIGWSFKMVWFPGKFWIFF